MFERILKSKENNEKDEIKLEIIVKIPTPTNENDRNKYEEIYEVFHQESITNLMEIATNAENKAMSWLDQYKTEERTNGMSKEQVILELRKDIEECKRTREALNEEVEEVFSTMEGVKIKTEIEVKIGFDKFLEI